MHEMIEFALELKFGLNSKPLAKDIKEINDYDKLKQIKQAIRNHDSLEGFTDSLNL